MLGCCPRFEDGLGRTIASLRSLRLVLSVCLLLLVLPYIVILVSSLKLYVSLKSCRTIFIKETLREKADQNRHSHYEFRVKSIKHCVRKLTKNFEDSELFSRQL